MSPEFTNATSSPRISPDFMFHHSDKNSNGNSDSSSSLNGRARRRNIVDFTRKHYNEDFEAFILNNIAMVFVPFENYEEDLKNFRSKDSSRQQELRHLNQQFEKKYNKTVIYPDTFFEHVNKDFVFQRRCDASATSLIRERIYLIDKLVEVDEENTEEFEQNNNDTNEQSVKVKLLQSENNLGYVKLQNRLYRKSTVSSTSSWSSYAGNLTTPPRSYRSSNSTASSGESNRARTEDPLEPLDTDLLNSKKSWFKRVRNENFSRTSITIIESDAEQQVHKHHEYMSPTKYATDFAKEFKETIGMYLGLDPQRLKFSKTRSTIYCQSSQSINYEISPALDVNWPNELTTNWLQRRRNEMVDPNSKDSLPLQWPSDIALQEARLGKCIILPRYTAHKYETTMTDEFEWEIAFPRAEKYLQTTMTHAQTKTFFLLALIHRSFIEPLTKHKGVLLDHFKMFFYWEMEKTYVSFPETRMGSKVIDILKTIYAKLGERKLNHYFYGPDKNVFDNVSDNLIAMAQDQLNNILNNKVTYFIAALCNLRYASNDGFPQFDFKKLHQLLIDEHLVSKPSTKRNGLKFDSSPLIIHKSEKSQEWIDLKVPCKVNCNETVRKVQSLKLFIEHFLEVGRVCFVRSRMQLGRAYYLQAKDLTTILAEQGLHEMDVNTYTESIRRACPDL